MHFRHFFLFSTARSPGWRQPSPLSQWCPVPDSCKFAHIREDYKSGYVIEQEYQAELKTAERRGTRNDVLTWKKQRTQIEFHNL